MIKPCADRPHPAHLQFPGRLRLNCLSDFFGSTEEEVRANTFVALYTIDGLHTGADALLGEKRVAAISQERATILEMVIGSLKSIEGLLRSCRQRVSGHLPGWEEEIPGDFLACWLDLSLKPHKWNGGGEEPFALKKDDILYEMADFGNEGRLLPPMNRHRKADKIVREAQALRKPLDEKARKAMEKIEEKENKGLSRAHRPKKILPYSAAISIDAPVSGDVDGSTVAEILEDTALTAEAIEMVEEARDLVHSKLGDDGITVLNAYRKNIPRPVIEELTGMTEGRQRFLKGEIEKVLSRWYGRPIKLTRAAS